MDLNAKTILDHKVVAVVNLIWAIFHIWIAIEIEEDYGFLAIVIVFVLIFIGTYRISENIARYVFLVIGLLYLFPLVVGVIPTLTSSDSSMDDIVGSLIWLVVIAWTFMAGTAQWTGLGKSESEASECPQRLRRLFAALTPPDGIDRKKQPLHARTREKGHFLGKYC